MNHFNGVLFGAEVLFVPIALAVWLVLSADLVRRVIALQLIGLLLGTQLVLLSIAFAAETFADIGIALALLSAAAALMYGRFLERWL